ncbi:LysR substrate-binding domain-containing protein [uncultured Roseobacter sp.]|uniref:LysR substrate-binding domain-containing protein n=1 Tax=uncultured Roseobacter sp. TaxID=114847 RepID=UPI00261656F3|nr:LysR substrate-binding domain-containing protein [uncultured Roseobacter sp.]
MVSLPPLNGLRAFDAAGRRLSFRAAGDELGVTQGAVAQQVRNLETCLGVILFDRLPKGLALTQAGRSYHAQVSQAFEDLRTATAVVTPEAGQVLISVTPSFAAKWLIPNLPDFSTRRPEIDLRILATEKVSSFHNDGIDLAVRQGAPPFGAALNATLLFRQDVVAIATPDLVAASGLHGEANIIARIPKIHDTHNLWPKFLADIGVQDEAGRGLRLSQTALAVDAALSGQGAALVSRFLVTREIAAGHLVEILSLRGVGSQDFYLLSERRPKPNPAIEAVKGWLTTRAQEA